MVDLLLDLIMQRKTLDALSAEESQTLDLATIEFAQSSKKDPSKENSSSTQQNLSKTLDSTDQGDPEELVWEDGAMRLPTISTPVDIPTVPTRWWDKGPGGSLR